MASQRSGGGGGGGCVLVFAVLLVIAAVFWGVTSLGHLLGLTPTYSEVTDRPDGWVTRHYRGVAWGYLLTLLFIGAVAALVWLAARTQSEVEDQAKRARELLPRAGWGTAGLMAAIIALPIGERPGAQGNVPRLIGMNASAAEDALRNVNLGANFEHTPTDGERCKVVDQQPGPGAEVQELGDVTLRCVVPVPRVVGQNGIAASSKIELAGLRASAVNEPADSDLSRCRVKSQSPSGPVPPDSSIRLTLACKKPPPEPAPEPEPEEAPSESPSCDPNYSGCVPPYPPDADCADVAGPVAVIGDDVHGLDRDGDGAACES